jgi:uncharacterized protein (DUF1919 family)
MLIILLICILIISIIVNIIQRIALDIEKEKPFTVIIEDTKKGSKKLKLESKYVTLYLREDGYYQLTLSQDNYLKISQFELDNLKIDIIR